MRVARLLTVVIVAVLAVGLGSGKSLAQCNQAGIVGSGFVASGTYDPFSASDVSDPFTLTVRNRRPFTCSFGIVFHRASTPATLGGAITYEITDSSGSGSLITTTPANAIAPAFLPVLNVPGNSTLIVTYRVSIARGQVVAPATYTDPIEVWLYALAAGNLTLPRLHRDSLTVSYGVPTSISTNVAGGGQTTTVDFGELAMGESQSVDIEARSNVNYQVNVTSLRLGVLQQAVPLDSWTVDYSATLSGSPLALTTLAGTTLGPYTLTTASGRTHPLGVTVGSVSGKRAGTYSDEITLRIEVAP